MAERLRDIFELMGLAPDVATEEERAWGHVYAALLGEDEDYDAQDKEELPQAS